MKKGKFTQKGFMFKDYISHGIFFFFYGLVKYLPSPVGDVLRYSVAKLVCKKLGRVRIYEGVTFWYPYKISIGDHVALGEWVFLSGFGELEIENDVRIGHRTSILTSRHRYTDLKIPIYKQGNIYGKVKICQGALLGCNATILSGVTIGRGAIVGAGAVVTKDVGDYEIVVGVPAHSIKSRKNSKIS